MRLQPHARGIMDLYGGVECIDGYAREIMRLLSGLNGLKLGSVFFVVLHYDTYHNNNSSDAHHINCF